MQLLVAKEHLLLIHNVLKDKINLFNKVQIKASTKNDFIFLKKELKRWID